MREGSSVRKGNITIERKGKTLHVYSVPIEGKMAFPGDDGKGREIDLNRAQRELITRSGLILSQEVSRATLEAGPVKPNGLMASRFSGHNLKNRPHVKMIPKSKGRNPFTLEKALLAIYAVKDAIAKNRRLTKSEAIMLAILMPKIDSHMNVATACKQTYPICGVRFSGGELVAAMIGKKEFSNAEAHAAMARLNITVENLSYQEILGSVVDPKGRTIDQVMDEIAEHPSPAEALKETITGDVFRIPVEGYSPAYDSTIVISGAELMQIISRIRNPEERGGHNPDLMA